MLDELRRITSTEPYKSYGGMKVKEISLRHWDSPDAKMVVDIWIDEDESTPVQTWELTCTDLTFTQRFPQYVIAHTEVKLFATLGLEKPRRISFVVSKIFQIVYVEDLPTGSRVGDS